MATKPPSKHRDKKPPLTTNSRIGVAGAVTASAAKHNPLHSAATSQPTVGHLPLHIQISEMLIREIKAGVLANDERLPPERHMARRLQISVGTLRKALAELETKGMLLRVHGSGNYVQNNTEVDNVYALFRLELVEGGGLPTAELLSLRKIRKPASLPEFGKADHAYRFRRLRKLNGQLAAIEEIWLDASYADRISASQVPESLYLYYKEQLGFRIIRAEDRVGVKPLPDWCPAEFNNSETTHFGFVERQARDNNGRIAEYSRTWFDPLTVRFVAR